MDRHHLHNALATLLLLCTGGYAHGQTTVDGLTYTLDSEALTATLTDFVTAADDSIVNIPESIVAEAQTYAVTAIGDKVFYGRYINATYREKMQKVKAIIIPKTVKTIGSQAFDIPLYKGASSSFLAGNLESITFAEGSQLESIGKGAFGGRAIFELDLPEGLKTIGEEAFNASSNLKRIGLPSTLDSIGPNAFYRTDSLRQIALPNGLRVIAEKAFYSVYDRTGLTEVTLPASLQSIGAEAFNKVSLVKPLGATPPTIQSNTFPSNTSVMPPIDYLIAYRTADVWKDLNVTGGSFTNDLGRTFSIISANDVQLTSFGETTNGRIASVTIPESETVTHEGQTFQVAEYAANAFSVIDTLHVERSYTALPAWTFRQLKALYLPASIEDLTAVSFSNSDGVALHLSSPQPPTISSTNYIGTLYVDESLVPAYTEGIWSQVAVLNPFWEDGIRYSRQFTVEKKVAVIGSEAEQLVIPATVDHDGQAYSVARINGIGTETRYVTMASADTELGEGVFRDTYYLESVELPEGITTLPANLFANSGIKSVKLPSTLKVIGDAAFSRTTKLRHIDLPEGVRDIRTSAFFGSGIESLHLPASVINIWELALEAFMVKEFTVAENNPRFSAKDGILFTKDQSTLVVYPAGKQAKHYDMPSTVLYIANAAFYGSKLTSIRLSENYAGIAENAVMDGRRAAFSQDYLAVYLPRPAEVNILSNLGTISVIYLPASYRDSDDEYIQNLINELSDNYYAVRFENDERQPFEYYFTQQSGEVEAIIAVAESVRLPHNLNIPAKAIVQKLNSNSDVWHNFPDSYFNNEDQCYHIPVVGIYDNAFALCDNLVNVTLPAGLKHIGEAAFFGCKNLESVQGLDQMSLTPAIYERYSGIYNFAFAECPKLTQLDFGGIQSINGTHTVGSTNLPEVTISDAQLKMKIDEDHPAVFSEDGVVYNYIHGASYREGDNWIRPILKSLVYYPAAREATEFTIPDSVTEISGLAFAHSHIEKLTIPAMTGGNIAHAAFYGNHSLTEVVLLADSLSQLPNICTTEDYGYTYGYQYYFTFGRPYVYMGTRINVARGDSHGYAWTENYPSFDFDYTRENTVVYMKPSVINEYEALLAQQYDYANVGPYNIFKMFFKEIRPLQDSTGIESITSTNHSATQGWFTLDGRRISQPSTKGIYIHNGRKIGIK